MCRIISHVSESVCVAAAGSFLFETRLGCLQLQVPERTLKFITALQDMLTSSLYLIVGEQLHQKLNTSFWRRHADSWNRLFAIGQSHPSHLPTYAAAALVKLHY